MKYKVWSFVEPRLEDAKRIRRVWALVKGKRRQEVFRRQLVHDYCVARLAQGESNE